jgi:hypothetical protein
VDRRVRTDDVVVGQQMGEPQLLDPLAVRADRAGVSAELRLGKDHSDAHVHPSVDDSSPSSLGAVEIRVVNYA